MGALDRLADPEVRKRFDSAPEPIKKQLASMVWEKEVRPKLTELDESVLSSAKDSFLNRMLGTGVSTQILPSRPEETNTGFLSELGGKIIEGAAPIAEGAFRMADTGAKAIGAVTGLTPGGGFGKLADRAAEFGERTKEAHPIYSALAEGAAAVPVGGALSELLGPGIQAALGGSRAARLASNMATHGISWTPMAENVEDIPKQFLTGAVAGPILGWGFGKSLKAYTWALNKVLGPKAAGKAFVEQLEAVGSGPKVDPAKAAMSEAEIQSRAILDKLGVSHEGKTVSQAIGSMGPEQQVQYGKLQSELQQAQRDAAIALRNEEKAAKKAQREAKKSDASLEKHLASFRIKYGEPSESEVEILRKGGDDLKKLVSDRAKAKTKLSNQQGLLIQELQSQQRKAGVTLDEETNRAIRDTVNRLSLDEVNARLAMFAPKTTVAEAEPVVAPTPKTVTEAVPEMAQQRPDIAKLEESFKPDPMTPTQTEAVVEPRTQFSLNVKGEPKIILTADEAKMPQNVDIAIGRLRDLAKLEISQGVAQNAVATKYGPIVQRLRAEGMSIELAENGLGVLDFVAPKIGRPTKVESEVKTSAQRYQESLARRRQKKQAQTQEAQDELAAQAKDIGGNNLDAKFEDFKKFWGREPLESEKVMMSAGQSPRKAVDQEYQIDFENSNPDSGDTLKTVGAIGAGIGAVSLWDSLRDDSTIPTEVKSAGAGLLLLAMTKKESPVVSAVLDKGLASSHDYVIRSATQLFNSLDSGITRKILQDQLLNKTALYPRGQSYTKKAVIRPESIETLRNVLYTSYERLPEVRDLINASRVYIHGGINLQIMQEISKHSIAGRPVPSDVSFGYTNELMQVLGNIKYQVENPQELIALTQSLVSAVKKTTPQNIRLFRGMSIPSYNASTDRDWFFDLTKARPGDIVKLDRLQSFSSSPVTASGFGNQIHLETAGPIHRLNITPLNAFAEEESVTFGTFKVLRVVKPQNDLGAKTNGRIMSMPRRVIIQQLSTEVR